MLFKTENDIEPDLGVYSLILWSQNQSISPSMATPFRRPWVSWRVVSSIGELRGCTISGNRQDAGQATAAIPRSIGDDIEECHLFRFLVLTSNHAHLELLLVQENRFIDNGG